MMMESVKQRGCGWRGFRWCVVAVVLALVGVLSIAGTAGAASRGFVVHNYSGRDVRVVGATPLPYDPDVFFHFGFEGRPEDGSVMKPISGVQDWQLKYQFGRHHGAVVSYKILGTEGTVEFTIQTASFSDDSTCKVHGTSAYWCTARGLALSVRQTGPDCRVPPIDRVNWEDCDKRGSDLAGADLRGANLGGANLSGSILDHADLQQAHLARTQLGKAKAEDAQFQHADLSSADVRRTDFSGAQLQNANLSRSVWFGTVMYHANLSGANLTGVELERHTLDAATCSRDTIWPDGKRAPIWSSGRCPFNRWD
jgi:Pentapeptide repeats (8 copies)